MTWIDFVRYLAALSVLMTLCMDTIVPLRGLAIASNVLFIVYGIAGQFYPVLFAACCQVRAAAAASARSQRQAENVERGRRGVE